MLSIVSSLGLGLAFVSDDLKNDFDVVLLAVQQAGGALKYASESLRDNKDIVLAAVRQSKWAWKYASPRLKNDLEIARIALDKNPEIRYELSQHVVQQLLQNSLTEEQNTPNNQGVSEEVVSSRQMGL